MRVMISQPVRTDASWRENLDRYHETVEMLEAQEHEIWGTLSGKEAVPPGVNQDLWRLGRRLQDMAGTDAVYFMIDWEKDRQCRLEYEACRLYGKIPMNNLEFSTLGLLDFAIKYYPEALDWRNAKCQICGAENAIGYGMWVSTDIEGIGEWKFNERNIFLCDTHKFVADERKLEYLEPHIALDYLKTFASRPWEKMSPKWRKIVYCVLKNILTGYEAKLAQYPLL